MAIGNNIGFTINIAVARQQGRHPASVSLDVLGTGRHCGFAITATVAVAVIAVAVTTRAQVDYRGVVWRRMAFSNSTDYGYW